MPSAGDRIGHYTLINKIGRGNFGVVWLAEKRTRLTATPFAIKLPHNEDIDEEAIKQEVSHWQKASGHPNVISLIEADYFDGQIAIVSEYASDGSLESRLKQNGGKALSIEEAVKTTSGILEGLIHLHSKEIVHRDLKPANILFQGNTPRLADFGISRALKSTNQSSIVAGTPSYMAPEAFNGKRDKQTDIWSVGVILYQLLAGHLPFTGQDFTSLAYAIQSGNSEPLPESIPQQLHHIVSHALAKDPQHRYKSADEMLADLSDKSKQEVPPSEPAGTIKALPFLANPNVSPSPKPEPPPNNHYITYAVIGLIVVIGLLLGLYAIGFKSKPIASGSPDSSNNTSNQGNFTSEVNSSVGDNTNTSPVDRTPRIKIESPSKKAIGYAKKSGSGYVKVSGSLENISLKEKPRIYLFYGSENLDSKKWWYGGYADLDNQNKWKIDELWIASNDDKISKDKQFRIKAIIAATGLLDKLDPEKLIEDFTNFMPFKNYPIKAEIDLTISIDQIIVIEKQNNKR
jgi:serine/threonine protein kinase